MPKPKVVVDPARCRPERCPQGLCLALPYCERKVFFQEAPFEVPFVEMDLCNGCLKCRLACPLKAVRALAA